MTAPRSYVAIITQIETLFKTERASHAPPYHSQRQRSFGQPRQLRGCHWRTEGGGRWTPPDGLTFDRDTIEMTSGYVRSVSSDDAARVYDSVAAARIRGVDRRLATAVSDKMPFDGAMWTILTSEVGQMGPDAPPAVTVHSESWGGRRRPLTDCKGHRTAH
jgi:hypothetical protein